MNASRTVRGFSLIELLLAVTIIGILVAIAVPSFLGSRDYAKRIGDAKANAQVLRMALETVRADTGLYPTAGAYAWKADGTVPTITPNVNFTIKGASKMDFNLTINAERLSYTLTAYDTVKQKNAFKTDQTGADLAL